MRRFPTSLDTRGKTRRLRSVRDFLESAARGGTELNKVLCNFGARAEALVSSYAPSTYRPPNEINSATSHFRNSHVPDTAHALLTYSSDFGAARLDPCELRRVVPYTYTLSERSPELLDLTAHDTDHDPTFDLNSSSAISSPPAPLSKSDFHLHVACNPEPILVLDSERSFAYISDSSLPFYSDSKHVVDFDPKLLLGTLRTHQRAACDEEMVTLVCPRGTTISIQVAQYGASNHGPSCTPDLAEYQPVAVEVVGETNCMWPNALQNFRLLKYALLRSGVYHKTSELRIQTKNRPTLIDETTNDSTRTRGRGYGMREADKPTPYRVTPQCFEGRTSQTTRQIALRASCQRTESR
ncbi:hypothetical protein EVAR_50697_1 [Eumeta japonica]|uniref:Uncharacterized protein n=1 Tax=Eumeta variegata TaxID=151549 RepID=A0A4C1YSN1_EUMVA|nr:hypothetical protein EVAR_50697_1 [Eumeta japonica]